MDNCCNLDKSLQNHINHINTSRFYPIQKSLNDEALALGILIFKSNLYFEKCFQIISFCKRENSIEK
jgi:hypothetical protein